MKVTRQKNCYYHTCARDFHYMGIATHRAGHRKRREDCKITFTDGRTLSWSYSKPTKTIKLNRFGKVVK